MGAYANYTIRLTGSENEILKATEVFAEQLWDDDLTGEDFITIEETNQVVWLDDIVEMAKDAAKAANGINSFTIGGTIDDSESCGQYMDFLIEYKDNALTVQSSDWYYEAEMETEEDSDEKEPETYYILDGDEDGDEEVVTEVPLNHKEIIKL